MDRIQHSSATSTHQFTEGDPGNGVPATTVTALHMNGVQNELVHIIEEAGLTPDESNHTQVLQALGEIFLAKGEEASVPVVEVMAADSVGGILNVNLGTRATSVVVVVKGTDAFPRTLRLAGTVPSGSTVTVFSWYLGALTVVLASGTLNGNPGVLSWGDMAVITKDTAASVWWGAVLPTRGTVQNLVAVAVNDEADERTTADATLQDNLEAEATTRSSADTALNAEVDQLRAEVDLVTVPELWQYPWTNLAQKTTHNVMTIPLDPANTYDILGDASYTLDPSQASGPTTFSVTLRNDTTLLKRFSTGVISPMQASALDNEEKLGTLPILARISGVPSLKVQIWAAVGAGGSMPFIAGIDLLVRRVNRA